MEATLTDSGALGYYSHLPVLALAMTKKPDTLQDSVLECGAGWGSTPMLKLICKSLGYRLESYDSDRDWALQIGAVHVPDWSKWEPVEKKYFVAFIDCAPGDVRKDIALRLKDRATFIILHDAECDPPGAYGYDTLYPHFTYRSVYRTLKPNTLVLSNFRPFPLED